MPGSLTGAFQTAEQRRDYQTYLLVARNELKKALKNLVRPEAIPGVEAQLPARRPTTTSRCSVKVRQLREEEEKRARDAMRPPPPKRTCAGTSKRRCQGANARRGRLVANLKSVETRAANDAVGCYQRMLQDLLE